MNFVRFAYGEGYRYGVVEGDRVLKITGDIFQEFQITKQKHSLQDLKILTPCLPSKIIALALNYRDHAWEHHTVLPEEPLIFFKPPSAALAHEEEIVLPPGASHVDYEAELVVIIKDKIKNVEPEEAWKHILGYTCGNDVSARDIQKKDRTWPARSKGFDTFAPLGPFMVSEIDPSDLKIELYLNGKIRQSSSTKQMVFKVPQIVSFLSKVMTLYPGDAIFTGTPSGVGKIKAGDVIEIKIENIGTLRNRVVRG